MDTHLQAQKNSRAVRWYVMLLPASHVGPAPALQQELDRRIRYNEPLFEFFAPSYVEVKKKKGAFVQTNRPLLYNYVFIHASEQELYRMKQTTLRAYNFLPRVREAGNDHYPYLTDAAMQNLQWVAEAYSNVLPLYVPEPDQLAKGDRVRITEGQFAGVEATVMIQPGAGRKDILVCIDQWMWVPLLNIPYGSYEVIQLNEAGKHNYTRLDNEKLHAGLHEALGRYYAHALTDADRRLATDTLRQFANLQMTTDVMRCKHYSLLLLAHTILQHTDEANHIRNLAQAILPLVKAEQSKALLLATLYGCTDNHHHYEQVHLLTAPWKKEENLKKSKRQLLDRLADYDRWLQHR